MTTNYDLEWQAKEDEAYSVRSSAELAPLAVLSKVTTNYDEEWWSKGDDPYRAHSSAPLTPLSILS